MNYEECTEKISRFLSKESYSPVIIDFPNRNDLKRFLLLYKSNKNKQINLSEFCAKNKLPNIENFFNFVSNEEGTFFITGVDTFLKFYGEERFSENINELLNMPTAGHMIIVTLQCKRYFHISDPRMNRLINIIDGENDCIPEIILCDSSLPLHGKKSIAQNFKEFASVIESENTDKIYFITNKTKNNFPDLLYDITEIRNAYDAVVLNDLKTRKIDRTLGTDEQWNYALSLFKEYSSWDDIIESEIGNYLKLDTYFEHINQMTPDKLWLYYIALKLYGTENNVCLNDAIKNSHSIKDVISNIYRNILNKSPNDPDFWNYYKSRKSLLEVMDDNNSELPSYCKVVEGKGKNAIYFLTDCSQPEKEKIFYFLDKYGLDWDYKKLKDTLKKVYPELYYYLLPYDFKNDILNDYFNDYKYQKVINKLFPEFYEKVLEYAKNREYNLILDPRSKKAENLAKPNSLIYFMDAMGVEYLGYIKEICRQLKLNINIKVCRAELPTITIRNKEFLNEWNDDQIKSIKDIDNIKHHGENNFDYYHNSKLPIHLIAELKIIRDILEKIKTKLENGETDEVFMIADHGASRLCVLYDKENIWEMAEKGEHSGRCCLKSEIDEQPEYAADAGEYWSLANYDRFKGGRCANVEVHGGATLEEICVPIIKLTYSDSNIEVYIMPVDLDMTSSTVPEIEVSFRKKAAIKIFATEEIDDVNVIVNSKKYYASKIDDKFYRVDMPDIKKANTYYMDIYTGDTLIAEKLPFKIKREGQKERDLFGGL